MADIINPTTNVSLYGSDNDPDISAAVTTTTTGPKTMLDVNAVVSGDESPTKYQLLSDYDATGTSVTTADTELFGYLGVGVLSFITIRSSSSSLYEVIINIDGTERLRISMAALGSNIGLTSGEGVPIWVGTANKEFHYHPTPEIGFTTGFSIEARATSGTQTLTHLILYKEKT